MLLEKLLELGGPEAIRELLDEDRVSITLVLIALRGALSGSALVRRATVSATVAVIPSITAARRTRAGARASASAAVEVTVPAVATAMAMAAVLAAAASLATATGATRVAAVGVVGVRGTTVSGAVVGLLGLVLVVGLFLRSLEQGLDIQAGHPRRSTETSTVCQACRI